MEAAWDAHNKAVLFISMASGWAGFCAHQPSSSEGVRGGSVQAAASRLHVKTSLFPPCSSITGQSVESGQPILRRRTRKNS